MRVAGVDEAGRGCVIGPLVVAAAVFDKETIPLLAELGVKDSKKLSVKKRLMLNEEIKELALGYNYFEIDPWVIDKVVFRAVPLRRLNYLETMVMASLVRELEPDLVYMDPPDVDNIRCAIQVKSVIKYDLEVVCEPKADDKYVATGAASILAKVRRDQLIAELRELHGDFNSGYSSDRKTQQFIEEYFRDNTECPGYMRASWSTVQRHLKKFRQTTL